MAKTVSLHVGGGQAHRAHNTRRYKAGQAPDHIDPARRGQNSTLIDIPPRRAYQELFGEAVAAYNERQKRADRRITDYFKQVCEDETRHPVYEVIIQVGDRDDTGVQDCETEEAILKEFVDGWEERNPHLKLIGAYIHRDETAGTIHCHIDFIPWADGYKRGPERQCSMSQACEQMGYHKGEHIKETAQAAWTAAERATLEAITEAHGIEVKHVRDGRLHEADKALFIAERKVAQAEAQADQMEAEVAKARAEKDTLNMDIYRLQKEARGQGCEYVNTSRFKAVMERAAQANEAMREAAELRHQLDDMTETLHSDPDLWTLYRIAASDREAGNQAKPFQDNGLDR